MMKESGKSRGQVLMLVEKSSHCLSFYDRKTTERLNSIALPRFSHEIAVTADRGHAYVAHYGVRTSADAGDGGTSIAVVDLAACKVSHLIDCRPYGRLHGIALDGHGRLLVLSEAQNVLLSFDDPLTATAPSRAVASGGLKSHLFAVSGDGTAAYCCNLLSHTVTKVSPRDATIAPIAISPGERPEGLWLSPDGDMLYVANRLSDTLVAIETASMTIVKRMATRRDPLRIYGMSRGRLLVANCGDRSISVVDAETMRELAVMPLGGIPLAAHIRGETAFISLTGDTCAEVDLSRLAVVSTFWTNCEPDSCFLLDPSMTGTA
ncbi:MULTISPECIES: YncE family protein [unclassified Ensifer]|uniref:YncE family protein n=1 Tax=unclassified Ensifer TaxID=2633371 RepID=UPI00301008FA